MYIKTTAVVSSSKSNALFLVIVFVEEVISNLRHEFIRLIRGDVGSATAGKWKGGTQEQKVVEFINPKSFHLLRFEKAEFVCIIYNI